MKNVHILPTDKPIRLHTYFTTLPNYLFLSNEALNWKEAKQIYITNDEEIKDGDYYLYLKDNSVQQFIKKHHTKLLALDIQKKIILTTDYRLAPDVQKIDDEFLEWFVKNPSCEEIEVVKEDWKDKTHSYEIIIPKKEPKQETQGYICPQTKKQCDDECCVSAEDCHIEASFGIVSDCEPPKQETLEEVAERIFSDFGDITRPSAIKRALELAKWQEVQILYFLYSEIIERRDYSASKMCEKVIEFIEQFKNK